MIKFQFSCSSFYSIQIYMGELLISLLFILIAYAIYTLWIYPLKLIKSYVRNLRKLGYNVLQVPYNPFKNDMIETMRKGAKLGDVFKLYKEERRNYDVIVSNSLNRPRLQFQHPDFIKDFYSLDKHFEYPKTQSIVKVFSRIAGQGLFFSQNQIWKRKRSLFNKIFNFDLIKSQSNKIGEISSMAIAEIQKKSKGQNPKQITYNVIQLTAMIFSNVMMVIFLGGSLDQYIQGETAGLYLKKLIDELSAFSFTPINFILGATITSLGYTKKQRQVNEKIRKYREWGMKFIEKRTEEINKKIQNNSENFYPSNIFESIILQKKKNGQSSLTSKDKDQIFEQFTSFFMAGTDTTTNYTQMMIYQIARHSEVERKIREQIETFMVKDDYSFQNLKKFKYLQLIQKEVTRTYGPINSIFSRKCRADTYLNGLPIKKDTGVFIMYVGNNYSEKYYKNPSEFRPERWLNECDEIPTYAIGGFGGGARTCIGKHLALLQSKIALIKFLKRYSKITLGKENFNMKMKFTYAPQDFQSTMQISS